MNDKERTMARNPHAPRITIDVTEEIIKGSTLRDSSHCMIAEALRAAYPDAKFVSVDLQTIRLTDKTKGLRYTYLTPRAGQVALVNFDQGVTPEPFSMQLKAGQVTTSHPQRLPAKPESQAQIDQRRAALQKARLAQPTKGSERMGMAFERVGGKTPPLSSFARRREFGLRGLNR